MSKSKPTPASFAISSAFASAARAISVCSEICASALRRASCCAWIVILRSSRLMFMMLLALFGRRHPFAFAVRAAHTVGAVHVERETDTRFVCDLLAFFEQRVDLFDLLADLLRCFSLRDLCLCVGRGDDLAEFRRRGDQVGVRLLQLLQDRDTATTLFCFAEAHHVQDRFSF